MKHLLLTAFVSFFFLSLANAQKIKISGKVTDANNIPLPSATIEMVETGQKTLSDEEGKFNVSIDKKNKTIRIGYIGYQTKQILLEGNDQNLKIQLEENLTSLNKVVVYSEISRGQAKALNTQKNSLNIANVVDAELFSRYPDVNAAEVVQRLPGISIVRDQGEGEFVQVRGIPEQYNSLTINGQRMPSLEQDAGRAVGLDLVQSALIQKITVNKALSADMDGDAIGGMINFELKKATKPLELELVAGYGLNQQESQLRTYGKDINTFTALFGKRMLKNKLGMLVTGNYFNTDKGSLFYARGFQDRSKDTIHTRRSTDYDVKRERYGLVGNFDYQTNPNNTWNVTLNYNRYKDFEIRRQANYTLSNSREERRTRNRLEDQKVLFSMLKGEHKFTNLQMDYSISYSDGTEDIPDRIEYRFRRTNNNLKALTNEQFRNLTVNSTFNNATAIKHYQTAFSPTYTNEKSTGLATNFKLPFLKNGKSVFKFGAKYRILNRDANVGASNLTPRPGSSIPDVAEGGAAYEGIGFLSPEFLAIGLIPGPDGIDYNKISTGYTASEKVSAVYLLNEFNWSPKWVSSIGVRVENTHTDYKNRAVNEGKTNQYTNLLPSAHFTYKIDQQNQLRLAYSSGLSRPNYAILNPYEEIATDQINRGNPNLKAITANNLDIMFEQYTGKLGFFSLGVFGKLLKKQIFIQQVGTNDNLPIFMPTNGEGAHLFGVETAMNQSLSSLKIPIRVNANYTFTYSKSKYDATHDNLPLANSPKHTANLSFIYDNTKAKFSTVLAGSYRHFVFNKFEDTDITSAGTEAIWLDKTFHLDFSTSYNFYKNFTMKFQLNNLTNQANIEVSGKPNEKYSRWTEKESYGISGMFILEWKL